MYGVIYKITNTLNGKFYIGQTKMRLSARWSKHKRDARAGAGWILAAAIRKYGHENFSLDVLDRHNSRDELNAAEVAWIQKLQPEYNCCAGGGGLGSPTEEVRQKIADAGRGRQISDETRRRMQASQKGHPVAPETIAKIRASLAPRYQAMREARIAEYGTLKRIRQHRPYVSPYAEVHEKVRAVTSAEKSSASMRHGYATGRIARPSGEKNPMFGRTKDPKIKQLLSAANRGENNPFHGRTHSLETRKKMATAHALRPPATCPNCGKTGHLNAMKRWHFDNCRSRT
jgi:group I intron endonuclease